MGTGEKLSCRMFSAILESKGVPSVYVPLDKCLDYSSSSSSSSSSADEVMLDQKFYDHLKRVTSNIVAQSAYDATYSYRVPVVTGYVGFIPGGILDAIGRGYTDFTAALVAAGLKTFQPMDGGSQRLPPFLMTGPQTVGELQIWKEVDGIFTADPRKGPNARLLTTISPDEAAELTYYGSEVIHPFTMEQVIRAKVPIR